VPVVVAVVKPSYTLFCAVSPVTVKAFCETVLPEDEVVTLAPLYAPPPVRTTAVALFLSPADIADVKRT
jgi:hypothetical protein